MRGRSLGTPPCPDAQPHAAWFPCPSPGPALHLVVLQHCRKWKVWLLWKPVGPGQPGSLPQPRVWCSSLGLPVGGRGKRSDCSGADTGFAHHHNSHLPISCLTVHYRTFILSGAAIYLGQKTPQKPTTFSSFHRYNHVAKFWPM